MLSTIFLPILFASAYCGSRRSIGYHPPKTGSAIGDWLLAICCAHLLLLRTGFEFLQLGEYVSDKDIRFNSQRDSIVIV